MWESGASWNTSQEGLRSHGPKASLVRTLCAYHPDNGHRSPAKFLAGSDTESPMSVCRPALHRTWRASFSSTCGMGPCRLCVHHSFACRLSIRCRSCLEATALGTQGGISNFDSGSFSRRDLMLSSHFINVWWLCWLIADHWSLRPQRVTYREGSRHHHLPIWFSALQLLGALTAQHHWLTWTRTSWDVKGGPTPLLLVVKLPQNLLNLLIKVEPSVKS